MNKKVIIIGAGGHGKVIADIVIKNKDIVIGFLDDSFEKGTAIISNYKVLGKISDCNQLNTEEVHFIIAIGNNEIRKNIAEKYNLKYYTAIHPTATIGMNVKIKNGTTIMANACINSNTSIGNHAIINTGAIIEHDNVIGDYTHISPNATLCGTVEIGTLTHIGASATIINNKKITHSCIIGAGTVVVNDINESGTYVGCPAKKIK